MLQARVNGVCKKWTIDKSRIQSHYDDIHSPVLVAHCKSSLSNQMINPLICLFSRDLVETTVHTITLALLPTFGSCCLAIDRKKDQIPSHRDDDNTGGPRVRLHRRTPFQR